MSEAKFTKGEWVSFYPHELLNSGNASVENELGRRICTSDVYKSNLKEVTANMNLIAAAPEMYKMLDLITDSSNMEDAEHALRENFQEALKLLAKARGEHNE